ncbi:NUDIX domain protein [Mycobacterium kansasii]|uniref:NUDIX domain protein n=1 Tax=Mycobacterium kansasii TaxID=1768 RepID=A0A1V3WB44_MYCKA|nr:NUDIX domain protein [Mycobacterium kansasii]
MGAAGRIARCVGEPAHLTAARELQEEAGLQAASWQVLVDLDSTPGFSDESVRVYLATGSARRRNPRHTTKRPT